MLGLTFLAMILAYIAGWTTRDGHPWVAFFILWVGFVFLYTAVR